ncbi:MAG TPA: hypothetical protein VI895_01245 [Bdellovibrionota bacterium]|nr:hypothetical protein [Bdellovibrionota bacterium]
MISKDQGSHEHLVRFVALSFLFLLLFLLPFTYRETSIAFAQNKNPSRITGRLEILQVDNFENPVDEKMYLLEDSVSHKIFQLHFPGEPPAGLSTGSTISVQGKVEGSEIYLDSVPLPAATPLLKDR